MVGLRWWYILVENTGLLQKVWRGKIEPDGFKNISNKNAPDL
jgi:hypothetical protein